MNNKFKIKFINCKEQDLNEIGFDENYIRKGINKHKFRTIKIYNTRCAQANIIKQTALSLGADCAVHREVITGKIESSNCILSATLRQYEKIIEKLKQQPLQLSKLAKEIENLLSKKIKSLYIREMIFDWNRPYIMGILNLTPDSFSDGNLYTNEDSAIQHYKQMIMDGADIIDIGGESTRPFSTKISLEEEQKRVIPIIEKIRAFDKKTVISIDTRNALTAKAAIEAGADIINDISALDWDKEMINVIKEKNCPIIINHSSGSPDIMQTKTTYSDVVDDIYDYLQNKVTYLQTEGVDISKIIIDVGIGFGKTTEQNFEILKRIEEFKSIGCAILIGHSRKNFLKETIDSSDINKLDEATALVSQRLIKNNNVNIIRVHNIEKNKTAVKIEKSFL